MQKLEVTIPFSGFYCSLHDSELDQALKSSFSDNSGNCNDDIIQLAFDAVHWGLVHNQYAREYCAQFAKEFKISGLTFDKLRSPKEYNFTTDRIFATLDIEELRRILSRVTPENLAAVARAKFTSRSGFISFYSPDVCSWGELGTWDHNQTGALIEALANQENQTGDCFDSWAEHGLMEDAQSNGLLDNWIFGSNPDTLNRLDKINRYLNTRAER
ncbi:hypothetical protein [Curvibacter phage PCA1]|nr:hypothetical protein [Curvibacter phage PCA1]